MDALLINRSSAIIIIGLSLIYNNIIYRNILWVGTFVPRHKAIGQDGLEEILDGPLVATGSWKSSRAKLSMAINCRLNNYVHI